MGAVRGTDEFMRQQHFVVHQYNTVRSVHWTEPFSVGHYLCPWRERGLREPERSTDYAFNLSTKGVFERQGRDGRVLVDGNRVVWFDREERYRSSHPLRTGDEGIYLRLSPEIAREVMRDHADVSAPTPRFALPCVELDRALMIRWYRLWRSVNEGLTDDELFEQALGLTIDLLAAADYAPQRAAMRWSARRRVHQIQALIAGDPCVQMTLDELAQNVGWSRFQLCRAFRRATGCSVHAYREQLRVGLALHRLIDRRVDLSELGLSLGYVSHSHFSQRFRRMVGQTPSAWRSAQM